MHGTRLGRRLRGSLDFLRRLGSDFCYDWGIRIRQAICPGELAVDGLLIALGVLAILTLFALPFLLGMGAGNWD